jgi:hypothetical protein
MFAKMYAVKKKRVRDPSLPPPPNLLSHDKTIRGINMTLEQTQAMVQQQAGELQSLKNKLNQAMYRIELLTNYMRNSRK